jgi:hypothetical protein
MEIAYITQYLCIIFRLFRFDYDAGALEAVVEMLITVSQSVSQPRIQISVLA